jgi:hypothetical protein
MAKPRKRAPGAGRKPQGEFDQLTSIFAVRMPQDIRQQLEAAAKKNRRSTGQELLRRLYDSFGIGDKNRDPALRAICFLISELADKIIYVPHGDQNWHNNKFLFRALRIGIAKLLDEIEPKGAMPPSPTSRGAEFLKKRPDQLDEKTREILRGIVEVYRSPQTLANFAAFITISDLYRGPHPNVIKTWKLLTDPSAKVDEETRAAAATGAMGLMMADRTQYGMEQARRDLEITKLDRPDTKPTTKRKS